MSAARQSVQNDLMILEVSRMRLGLQTDISPENSWRLLCRRMNHEFSFVESDRLLPVEFPIEWPDGVVMEESWPDPRTGFS